MTQMRPLAFSRETTVATIAGVMVVFAGWAWGGVVLWTQFATCGLGALALLVALTPRDQASPSRAAVIRGHLCALAIGAALGVSVAAHDWMSASNMRAATLQLIPDAALPPLETADWAIRGALVATGSAVSGMFIAALRAPTHARTVLLRFPPFWIGAALFGYIAVQSLNPWGLVVERDLTWKIIPQDPVSWLPAGLDAPFIGDRDPGGMNGWRQILILSGPWMLLCALRVAISRRRPFATLAWLVGLNSLAIGIVGAVVASGKDFSFLGFRSWFAYHAPFGPFIYRNHAGIYLYLSAALMLALTAHLIARKGDRADRGGPHLIAAVLFVMLCLASASTLSIGAIMGAAGLLALAPALYFIDRRVRAALSPVPAIVMLACALAVIYAATSSANLGALRQRIERKLVYVERQDSDDRAPIRRATMAQIRDGDLAKLAFGWGAGSYRWTSPPYFAQQPEFVDAKGRLWARANYAHCDWLQILLELGVAGVLFAAASLFWLGCGLRKAWRRRSASQLALGLGVTALLLHLTLEFALSFTPILSLLSLMIAWIVTLEDGESASAGG